MSKLKKNPISGITLIALVVTIIVLLLLAGISIQMLAGNNGILTRAKEAKINWENASSEEQQVLNDIEQQMAEIINETLGELDENTLVGMFKKAQKESCTNEDGTCTDQTHLHIGDWVNYVNPASGSHTVTAGTLGHDIDQTYDVSLNQLNWRVLGLDKETGGIKLIAETPMEKSNTEGTALDRDYPYLTMKGAEACVNSVSTESKTGELDAICELYANSYAKKARSINRKDIDEAVGITTTEQMQAVNKLGSSSTINYGESYSFENQWTPESWIENGNDSSANSNTWTGAATISGIVTECHYTINHSTLPTVSVTNTRLFNMLFDGTTGGSGNAYWLSSIGVKAYTSSGGYVSVSPQHVATVNSQINVSSGLVFTSKGGIYGSIGKVRPVVVLKSTIKKDQVGKIADK